MGRVSGLTFAAQRRPIRIVLLVLFALSMTFVFLNDLDFDVRRPGIRYVKGSYDWSTMPQRYPVAAEDMIHLPSGTPRTMPRIQHDFSKDPRPEPAYVRTQEFRRNEVKKAMVKCWENYRDRAFGFDELTPMTGGYRDPFNGWGATLVDSLDTLWIMDLKEEFYEAVKATATIDWNNSTTTACNLFETNIRYLGGLLSAYDLSGERALLNKALELGHMLYAAFDTPNRMPPHLFNFESARLGLQTADSLASSAAIGTLGLEFTRLSQLTGDNRFYDAVDRISRFFAATQNATNLPGLWPVFVDMAEGYMLYESAFSLGANADSLYEYFPKLHLLLGGLEPRHESMYRVASAVAARHLLWRPVLPPPDPNSPATALSNNDILFTGPVSATTDGVSRPAETEHLGCFAGGMFALGARVFGIPHHERIGERLARGCAYAYAAFSHGIMPEVLGALRCETTSAAVLAQTAADPNAEGFGAEELDDCEWDEEIWRAFVAERGGGDNIPRGFTHVRAWSYVLRPEAIESLFILYRITGKADLRELAWNMFEAIIRETDARFGNAALADVSRGRASQADQMEVCSVHMLGYLQCIS